MSGGPDLASAPLARAVLARGSWRPAGVLGTHRLLGGLAAHRAPLLEGARRLQAWHDGLAQRWRPLDTVQPAGTVARAGPISPVGIAAPSALVDGAATARGAPEPGGVPIRKASGRAAPARIDPAPGGGSRAQRLPAAALAPARSALTIAVLATAAGDSATPVPVPFRWSTGAASAAADPPTGGPVLVPAIGRRFARREVAGGFPEAASRDHTEGGETAAARPRAALVRWRPLDDRSSDDAHRRTGARPPGSDRDGELQVAPVLPALRAEPPLPAYRTPDPATSGAGFVARPGASEAVALPGLSLRLVAPEEAARRLAQGEDAPGRRDEAPGARSEAGARRESPPSSAKAAIDIGAIVDRVVRELKRREQFERERKGLL